MLPMSNTKTFAQIWNKCETFMTDLEANPLSAGILSESNQMKLYCLLFAKYGNNPIANLDENQFKFKVYSIIFTDGGNWQKKLEIQAAIHDLSIDEIQEGTKIIQNHALNPATAPGTGTTTELDYIDSQNTSNYKKSKVDAFIQAWQLLSANVSDEFLDKFKVCFKMFALPDITRIYVDDEEEGGDQ